MSRLLLSFLLTVLAWPVVGQSGTVLYNQSTRMDFNFPGGGMMGGNPMANRAPRSVVRPMVLVFTADGALFAAAPETEGANDRGGRMERDVVVMRSAPGAPIAMAAGGEMMAVGGFGGFGRGGSQDAVVGAYTDLSDGSYVEVREFLGRNFRIQSDPPSYPWRLTGEQAVFLGFPVFQAVAEQDSTTLEAWFTPDIPVPAGPAQYGGLPGLILTLAVDSNRVTYTATVVDTTTSVSTIKAPSDGSKVSRTEYDKIVAEKTAEMSRTRRGGRGN